MRVYTVVMNQLDVSAARTFIRLTAPSNAVLVMLRAWITQDNRVTSEQLPALIQRATTDGTGNPATPRPHSPGDPAFGGTAEVFMSGVPVVSGDPLVNESFNTLNGWLYVPMPEEWITVGPSGIIVLRMDGALQVNLTMSAGFVFGVVG